MAVTVRLFVTQGTVIGRCLLFPFIQCDLGPPPLPIIHPQRVATRLTFPIGHWSCPLTFSHRRRSLFSPHPPSTPPPPPYHQSAPRRTEQSGAATFSLDLSTYSYCRLSLFSPQPHPTPPPPPPNTTRTRRRTEQGGTVSIPVDLSTYH